MSEFSEDARYHLSQIVLNARLAISFVETMSFEEYLHDTRTRFACERALLNVSEAIRGLERAQRTSQPGFDLNSVEGAIPWAKAKGIGNILRHDYDDVRDEVIWATITRALPDLIKAFERHVR